MGRRWIAPRRLTGMQPPSGVESRLIGPGCGCAAWSTRGQGQNAGERNYGTWQAGCPPSQGRTQYALGRATDGFGLSGFMPVAPPTWNGHTISPGSWWGGCAPRVHEVSVRARGEPNACRGLGLCGCVFDRSEIPVDQMSRAVAYLCGVGVAKPAL